MTNPTHFKYFKMAFTNIDDDISWDDPATPIETIETIENNFIEPVIDPNGWHWYPDINGQLFTSYYDADGNECMMWRLQDDGSFYWRCAGVGYNCRDIGVEHRKGIFFQDLLVGTMILDENLSVNWLPETYINNNIININYIQYDDNINNIPHLIDLTDEEDDLNDP